MEIAKSIAPICLAIIMFGLGLGLSTKDFTRVVKKPRDFLIGFLCQVIVLPIIAFILITIISMPLEIALGVMIIAASPGGVTSNILTKFADGDVALSVSLTAIVSLLSIITVPLVVFNSAEFIGVNITKEISMASIAIKMFFVVTVPVIFGMIVRSLMTDFIISKTLIVQRLSVILFLLVFISIWVEEWDRIVSFITRAGLIAFILNMIMILVGYYASIVRLSDGNKIIKSKCLPDIENINFSGLGGGYVDTKENILIAIGTPTHSSDEIDLLSQNNNSIFGKILKISKKDLLNKNLKEVNYEFFTKGHRNPQGMAAVNENIYAIEHGPRGGDEINIIKSNNNYGWPINSYGLPYDKKKRYHHQKLAEEYYNPIYTFLPSIAPSALSNCPTNLKEYYSNNICLLGLSLRAMSLFVFLLDKDNSNLIAIEKVYLEKRLRHFGLKKDLSLYEDKDNSFYITTDDYEVIKIKFKNFKKKYVNN